MTDNQLPISVSVVRQSAVASAQAKALIADWRAFNWRRCTCVRCAARFGSQRPKVFIGVTSPEFDGIKAYGICRRCEAVSDEALAEAGAKYVAALLDGQPVRVQ